MNSRAALYLGLALVGLAVQLAVFGVFLGEEGLDFSELGDQMVETTIAVLALTDVLLSALVFLLWMPREAKRAGMDRWWPFALALAGGLCFALPLFLSARERSRVAGSRLGEPLDDQGLTLTARHAHGLEADRSCRRSRGRSAAWS